MTSTAASEIDEPAPPRERRQRVQAAETCLAVLKALATLGGRASLTAIAGAVEESPAKVHRYLASLMAEGLVEQDRGGTQYALAAEAMRVGLAADRKSTRLNSSHLVISYAVFCLKKKKSRPSPAPITSAR